MLTQPQQQGLSGTNTKSALDDKGKDPMEIDEATILAHTGDELVELDDVHLDDSLISEGGGNNNSPLQTATWSSGAPQSNGLRHEISGVIWELQPTFGSFCIHKPPLFRSLRDHTLFVCRIRCSNPLASWYMIWKAWLAHGRSRNQNGQQRCLRYIQPEPVIPLL